jgi:hypothetical protein
MLNASLSHVVLSTCRWRLHSLNYLTSNKSRSRSFLIKSNTETGYTENGKRKGECVCNCRFLGQSRPVFCPMSRPTQDRAFPSVASFVPSPYALTAMANLRCAAPHLSTKLSHCSGVSLPSMTFSSLLQSYAACVVLMPTFGRRVICASPTRKSLPSKKVALVDVTSYTLVMKGARVLLTIVASPFRQHFVGELLLLFPGFRPVQATRHSFLVQGALRVSEQLCHTWYIGR